MLITEQEARQILEAKIAYVGGAKAYAELLGVTASFVSQTRRGYITGKIAEDLGLEAVKAYNYIGPVEDEKQKQYANRRREHRERFENERKVRDTILQKTP